MRGGGGGGGGGVVGEYGVPYCRDRGIAPTSQRCLHPPSPPETIPPADFSPLRGNSLGFPRGIENIKGGGSSKWGQDWGWIIHPA